MMLAVIDCETTGLDPKVDNIVEIAIITMSDDGWPMDAWSSLVNPGVPLPAIARAVHHLNNDMVVDAPSPTMALLQASIELQFDGRAEDPILVAHNAPFDSGFLYLPIPICTWRCANHLWPDAPSHKNQVLRYWLPGLEDEVIAAALAFDGSDPARYWSPPHRALPDAWITAMILRRLMKETTVERLVELTTTPIVFKKVFFGMHYGKLWSEVPKDYLWWLKRQKDVEPDIRSTVEYHLGISPPR